MREAADFIHAEGWDQPPTLFGLVPASVIARETGSIVDDEQDNLTLVVQELPDMGSGDELQDYIARTAWPRPVAGVGPDLAGRVAATGARDRGAQ